MKRLFCVVVVMTTVLPLTSVGGASAAIVTLGSPLDAEFEPSFCSMTEPCTGAVTSLPESGAIATSPVDGAVVRWRMLQAEPTHTYRLRVLVPGGGTTLSGAGTGPPVKPSGSGVETFPAALPIQKGDVIGFDLEAGARIGFDNDNGAVGVGFVPSLADGEARSGEAVNGELAINADVQPAPTISAVSPTSGSFKGGTKAIITGTDFEGTAAVAFGGVPATSFSVDTEGQITAVAPPIKPLAKVPVSVTTIAGTATAAIPFTGTACVVPNLKGKKLKAARRKLKKRNCKLGKVRGGRSGGARVLKQRPKAGKKLAPGARVKVTVGARKKQRKRRRR